MSDRLFFSTDTLPERDRFPAFCEEIVRRYAAVDIVPRDDGPFRGVIEMRRAGPVDVSWRFTTPANYVRSPRLLGDGNNSVIAVLCRSGGAYQSQLGYDVTLKPGDAIMCDCGYAGGLHMTADFGVHERENPTGRDHEIASEHGSARRSQVGPG